MAMSAVPARGPSPMRLRVVGIVALVWNLAGVAMFVLQMTMSPGAVASLTEAERAVRMAMPGWVDVAFGLAVATGVAGAIGLLLRRAWAVEAFAVSLLALVVQVIGAYVATPAWSAFGAQGLAMPVLLLVIAVVLWRYAARARTAGALR